MTGLKPGGVTPESTWGKALNHEDELEDILAGTNLAIGSCFHSPLAISALSLCHCREFQSLFGSKLKTLTVRKYCRNRMLARAITAKKSATPMIPAMTSLQVDQLTLYLRKTGFWNEETYPPAEATLAGTMSASSSTPAAAAAEANCVAANSMPQATPSAIRLRIKMTKVSATRLATIVI